MRRVRFLPAYNDKGVWVTVAGTLILSVVMISLATWIARELPAVRTEEEFKRTEALVEGLTRLQGGLQGLWPGDVVNFQATISSGVPSMYAPKLAGTLSTVDATESAIRVIANTTRWDFEEGMWRSENGLSENIYIGSDPNRDDYGYITLDNNWYGNRFITKTTRTIDTPLTAYEYSFSVRFVAPYDGTVQNAKLFMYNSGNPQSPQYNAYIWIAHDDGSGRPDVGADPTSITDSRSSKAIGGSNGICTISAVSDSSPLTKGTSGWVTANFPAPVPLTKGTVYHLVIDVSNATFGVNPNDWDYLAVAYTEPRNTVWVDNGTGNEDRSVVLWTRETIDTNPHWTELYDAEPVFVLDFGGGNYWGNPYHGMFKLYDESIYYSDIGSYGDNNMYNSYSDGENCYSAGIIKSDSRSASDKIWGENFQLSQPTTISAFEVPVDRHGLPTSDLCVYLDSSGPYTIKPADIRSGDAPPPDIRFKIPIESLGTTGGTPAWYRITLDQPVTLAAGNHWIYLRTRGDTRYDYYRVPLDNASGNLPVNMSWDGANSRAFRADMLDNKENLSGVVIQTFDYVDMPFRLILENYKTNAMYTSPVLAPGERVKWFNLTWDNDTPENTRVIVEVRVGDMVHPENPNLPDDPDHPWSKWKPIEKGHDLSEFFKVDPSSGFDERVANALQYRIRLSTDNSQRTPKVWNVQVRYYEGVQMRYYEGVGTPRSVAEWVAKTYADFASGSNENTIVFPDGYVGLGGWEVVSRARFYSLNYGIAIVGAGDNIYLINSDHTSFVAMFWSYNVTSRTWTSRTSPTTAGVTDGIKCGVYMVWDNGNYIYCLVGSTGEDKSSNGKARHGFLRYDIANNSWTQLQGTYNTMSGSEPIGEEGAGDALAWVPGVGDNFIYALTGGHNTISTMKSNGHFMCYSIKNNVWTLLDSNYPWVATESSTDGGTDDGASLVWAGKDNLYALRGEFRETGADYDFACYNMTAHTWNTTISRPSSLWNQGTGGTGDGAGLVWVGGDNIYAMSGGGCTEDPRNLFSVYNISKNTWIQGPELPWGVTDTNGHRLACDNAGRIYAWRGYVTGYGPDIPELARYMPNTPNGRYTSAVIDLGEDVGWKRVEFVKSEPSGTSLSLFEVSFSEDGVFDTEPWYPVASGESLGENYSRYAKYRATFTSAVIDVPKLLEVHLYYTVENNFYVWTQTDWSGDNGQLAWNDVQPTSYYDNKNVSGRIGIGDLVLVPGSGDNVWGDNFRVFNENVYADKTYHQAYTYLENGTYYSGALSNLNADDGNYYQVDAVDPPPDPVVNVGSVASVGPGDGVGLVGVVGQLTSGTIIPTYTEGFEYGGVWPAGWTQQGGWVIAGKAVHSGSYAATVTGKAGSTNYMFSDLVDYFNMTSPHLNFWIAASSAAAPSKISVDASTDGGSTWTVPVVDSTAAKGQLFEGHDLSSLAGNSNVKFRWTLYKVGATSSYVGVDDITFSATAIATFPPTVTTNAATSVEETTATLNGNVTSDGWATITERGFYCDTSSSPTTKYTVSGTKGAYTKDMTSLSPGTIYYFKAFATNSVGTSYGSILNFRTKPYPPSSLTATAVSYSQINLTWTKGAVACKTKMIRKAGSAPSSRTDVTAVLIYDGTGSSYNDTGLTPITTYYYQAWSYTDSPEQLSDSPDATVNATTLPGPPTVTTNDADPVEETTATLNGNVTSDSGATITERGFYCDTSSSPTTKYTVSGTTGAYTKDMTDLSPGAIIYYFKAFATNSVGTSYGSILNFRARPYPPSSLTATAVSYSQINLTWTKGTGAWKTKILQKADSAPTSRTDGTVIYDDTGRSYNITGLDHSTTYYYQAWSYTDSPEQFSGSPDATANATTQPIGVYKIRIIHESENVRQQPGVVNKIVVTIKFASENVAIYHFAIWDWVNNEWDSEIRAKNPGDGTSENTLTITVTTDQDNYISSKDNIRVMLWTMGELEHRVKEDYLAFKVTATPDNLNFSAKRLSLRFRARRTEDIYGVRVYVENYYLAQLAVNIYNDNASNPGNPGENLTMENQVNISSTGWLYIGFQPVSLVKGNVYHIVVRMVPRAEWMQTDWSGGPTKPSLQVGNWDSTYNNFYDNENVDWSQAGGVRLKQFPGSSSTTLPDIHTIADSYVNSSYPNNNYGGNTTVYVGRYSGGAERGYLKFDLSSIPPNKIVTSATLYVYQWASGVSTTVQVERVDNDSWLEGNGGTYGDTADPGELCWDYQPDRTGLLVNPQLVNTAKTWYSWSSSALTSFVEGEYVNGNVVTLALIDPLENVGVTNHSVSFEAKEYTWERLESYLRITYADINYSSNGRFKSSIYDAGLSVDWGAVSWDASMPLSGSGTYTYVSSYDSVNGAVENFAGEQQADGGYATLVERHVVGGGEDIANHVVISEVFCNETSTDANEFVELYNPTTSSVNLGNWTLTHYNQAGAFQWALGLSGYTIQSWHYLLIGQKSPLNSVDWGRTSIVPDVLLPSTLQNGPGDYIVLTNADGTYVDGIRWGAKESGSDIADDPPYLNVAESDSIERKSGSTHDEARGNGYDTDDGSNDWRTRNTPQPQNAASGTEIPPGVPGYDMDIRENIDGVPSSFTYLLQMRYKLANSYDSFKVQVWDGSAWNDRGAVLTSTGWTDWSYMLSSSEVIGGKMQVRFIDVNPASTSQDSLLIDYLGVQTVLWSTSMNVKVRTGGTKTADDGTWSAWYQHINGVENTLMPDNRYVQYLVELSTTNQYQTPQLESIRLKYVATVGWATLRVSQPINENMAYDSLTPDNAKVLYSDDSGSSWTERSWQPIYVIDVDTDANGSPDAHEGNPYDENAAYSIYYNNSAGVRFTVSGEVSGKSKVTRGAWVLVRRIGSPPPNLSYTLYNISEGRMLAEGTVAPPDTSWSWRYIRIENVLAEGEDYRLYLSTAGGDEGNCYQWMSPGTSLNMTLTDCASYDGANTRGERNSGSGWVENLQRDVVFRFVVASSFRSSGELVSSVYDAGNIVTWHHMYYSGSLSPGTSIAVYLRSSENDSDPRDGGWSDWQEVKNLQMLYWDNRYIQYRVVENTTDESTTPVLHNITIKYYSHYAVVLLVLQPDPIVRTWVQTTTADFLAGRTPDAIGENVEVVSPGDVTLMAENYWGNEFAVTSGFPMSSRLDSENKLFAVRFVAEADESVVNVKFLTLVCCDGTLRMSLDPLGAMENIYWDVLLVKDNNGVPDMSPSGLLGRGKGAPYKKFPQSPESQGSDPSMEWYMPYPRLETSTLSPYPQLTGGQTYHIVVTVNKAYKDNVNRDNWIAVVSQKRDNIRPGYWINGDNYNTNRAVLFGENMGGGIYRWENSTTGGSPVEGCDPMYVLTVLRGSSEYYEGDPYYKSDEEFYTNNYIGQIVPISSTMKVGAIEFFMKGEGEGIGETYVGIGTGLIAPLIVPTHMEKLTETTYSIPIDYASRYSWARFTLPASCTLLGGNTYAIYIRSPSSTEYGYGAIAALKTPWLTALGLSPKVPYVDASYGGGSSTYIWSYDGSTWDYKDYRDLPFRFVTKYRQSGSFVSDVLDAGQVVDWQYIDWDETRPPGTDIKLYVLAGGERYGPFLNGSSLENVPNSRDIRYEVEMTSNDPATSPALHEVRIAYRGGFGSLRIELQNQGEGRTLAYEGGAVIVAQENRSTMYSMPSDMIVPTRIDDNRMKLEVNYRLLRNSLSVKSTALTAMAGANFSMPEEARVVRENDNMRSVEVIIVSDFAQAWYEYLQSVSDRINSSYHGWSTVTRPSEYETKLVINEIENRSIDYSETVREIEVQIL